MRWFIDPKNRKEALGYISKFSKRPVKAYAGWALKEKTGFYHDPAARLNLKALQANLDLLLTHKLIKKRIDVPSIVDESVIKEAAARLK